MLGGKDTFMKNYGEDLAMSDKIRKKTRERILVLSDTHGYTGPVIDFIRGKDFDRILHLGDYSWDGEEIQEATGRTVIAVRGNNDWGSSAPLEYILESPVGRILMVHGHKQGVYGGLRRLAAYAEFKGCSIALYGHTHVFKAEKIGHLILLNPGSAALPRDGKPSAAVLTLEEGQEPLIEKIYI